MIKKILLPLIILAAGFGVAALLLVTGPSIEPQPGETIAPLVRTVEVRPQTLRLSTRTNGIVVPRTESDLVPEVDGRVTEVSPSLVSGGFFSAGDTLLRIDTLDYTVALDQARAGLTRAESDLDNAQRTLKRQQDLVRRGAASDSQRDDALNRVRIADATLREAKARISRAQRDLKRTHIVAPYDGRVRSERVDVGQFVRRGTAVGTIYAVDFAEVRLPVQDEELAFLNLPLGQGNADEEKNRAPVKLRARFAGDEHTWEGQVVRTEGELDPGTRMVNVIAQVAQPYATSGKRPPLSVGLFVDAEIMGSTLPELVRLPRSAMRGESKVFVVGKDLRMHFRDVNVVRRDQDDVYINGGLDAGELVCVSPLQSSADGMRVRLADQPVDQLVIEPSGQVGPAS